jgi:hypothetical protein
MSLDYSDARVFRFVLTRLKLAGKTPRTAPGFFQRLNQRRAEQMRKSTTVSTEAANTRKAQHFMNSSNFVAESSSILEANAVVTYPGGAMYLYVDSAAWDNAGNPLGLMSYGEVYSEALARAAAVGDISQTTALDYDVDSYALMDTSIGLFDSYTFRDTHKRCEFDLSTLSIVAPVNRVGDMCIDLCLNEPGPVIATTI